MSSCLRFLFAIVTFVIGVVSSNFQPSSAPTTPSISPEQPIGENVHPSKVNQALTFSSGRSGIACGFDSYGHSASFSTSEASDGAVIRLSLIHSLNSEKVASKRFRQEIKKATKVIEVGPYLDYWNRKIGEKAIIEKGKQVSIVKYTKDSGKYNIGYYLLIRDAPSLHHALEFDRQEESLYRSRYLNKLKP